jgi:hypothetical protein
VHPVICEIPSEQRAKDALFVSVLKGARSLDSG